jgi:hypothetical protein
MDIFGGNAVSDEYHIGRIAANLHVANTYEGTHVSLPFPFLLNPSAPVIYIYIYICSVAYHIMLNHSAGHPYSHLGKSYHRDPGFLITHS